MAYLRCQTRIGTGRVICDDMCTGCPTMGPDGLPPNYDYFKDATTPDGR